MIGNLKIFFFSFLISLSFWWGINIFQKNLEDFVYWNEIDKNKQIFLAQVKPVQIDDSLKPCRDWEKEDLRLNAKSAISVLVQPGVNDRVLFHKNSDEKMPIASLTKLMTALVVLENYESSWQIKISKEAVSQESDLGQLRVGEIFTAKELLYPLLMESSNDAAFALSEIMGTKNFTEEMNKKAKELPMENTFFSNPSGIDPDEKGEAINYSTAEDLVKLIKYTIANPEILTILSLKEFDLYLAGNVFHHRISNSNQLLGKIPQVIAGKTGWTPQAAGCLFVISKSPMGQNDYAINIILGAEDRFGEMEKLINWINIAYQW